MNILRNLKNGTRTIIGIVLLVVLTSAYIGNYYDDEIIVPAIITEDIFHYAVHEGLAYDVSTYDASADQFICFKTPNTDSYLHLLWAISSEGNCRMDIYEGVTAASGGSDQAVGIKNRASGMNGGTASAVIAGNTSTAGSVQVGIDWTGGTVINPQGYFSGKNSAAQNASHEHVLEKNTWYGVHLVAIDAKDLGMTLTWFEVPIAQ